MFASGGLLLVAIDSAAGDALGSKTHAIPLGLPWQR